MAITDIQISEELETGAPSIKYRGNEGPKSPQEMEMMVDAMLEEEYNKYVFDLLEIRPEATPMTLEEFRQMVIAEGQMSKGPILPSPEDPVNPFQPKPQGPVLPDRQMAAYGGIMGMDGRRQYGIGSSLKKAVRKIIPNEIAAVAEKAAPFIALAAPQFALPAAIAGGLGSFDRTGKIGSSLMSGLSTYGLGQLSPGLPGVRDMGPSTGIFSKTGAMGGKYNIKDILGRTAAAKGKAADNLITAESVAVGDAYPGGAITESVQELVPKIAKETKSTTGILKTIKDFALDNKLLTGLAAGTLGAAALMGNMEADEIQDLQRGEGLDVEGIRAEVIEAMKDPSGEALEALRIKYPFLGKRDTKDMAMGGRIGKAEGGIMDLGGMEKDYRAEGGFVPIGREEKADDVPARLSVNEFVFTADAVRNAGGGDIDKGAEVMENMMKHLEQGGQVSDESQGMAGAQQMFETSERLSEVI
ncbi:MAG: hypothetical protein CMI76_03010 [Candidatus Pelagibacter sp.]|jgi:uncharacterized short protein YbdD (DUF466 family)|nr:hypothetical protein [Candidatus Pelagibacter sp.]